tara:strand:+ start:887 stop:1444 length:558 start_codon:yes stop_codon:yes gene_type:complete
MTPMDEAWMILKRQTTLGEFHPDMPSPYGPVTMMRLHPTKDWYKQQKRFDPLPKNIHPPYESLIQTGLPTIDSDKETQDWEDDIRFAQESGAKMGRVIPFDLSKPGTWVAPYKGNITSDLGQNRKLIGMRIPVAETKGQFRNQGLIGEGAEAYIQQNIPPELLVSLPPTTEMNTENTWGDLAGTR